MVSLCRGARCESLGRSRQPAMKMALGPVRQVQLATQVGQRCGVHPAGRDTSVLYASYMRRHPCL